MGERQYVFHAEVPEYGTDLPGADPPELYHRHRL